ncbi:hypothetical protein [Variovorax sp. EBFNA2]|uniref:hypothetical protein n=1 Tax=Variovorax sp. EBFNA2 TaxID=3342097 RepID=UPI0029C06F7F|nr:hypothetical protein [Variovorax boronicumulans]WPG39210.1 hypothetical protein RZE79_07725 [Variovorax boronicumulans]
MLVTFDSNVWRAAADPSRFPKNTEYAALVKINAALKSGAIVGVLCETVFTLEGIARADRKNFLVAYRPKVKITEEELPDGTIKLGLSLGPERSAHPGNNSYLSSHLTDALAVGFKLMRCPRVAGVQNVDLKDEWFYPTSNEYANRFGEVGRRLEGAGAGIAVIKAIGNKYAAPNEPWFEGLARAPASEDGPIAKAVAEWADADSVAAHVANGNALFCTNDAAVAAGVASTFAAPNRQWLEVDYGVKFVSPSELAAHL